MKLPHKAALAGTLTFALGIAALAALGARDRTARRAELERDAQVVAYQLASRMRSGLEQHRIALQQIANFFENSQTVREEQFNDFASATLKLAPRCLRISSLDASLRVQWIYPPDSYRSMIGFDIKANPPIRDVVQRARETREAALSGPLQLIGGPPGFVLAVPVFRRGRFLGEVVGTFRNTDFFESMMIPGILERYDQAVLGAGQILSGSQSVGSPELGLNAGSDEFTLGGTLWQVRVRPRREVVRARLRSGQAAFWILGAAACLAGGVGAGAWVRRRSPEVRQTAAVPASTRRKGEEIDATLRELLQTEKMAALGDLVSGVAHELNNPLCSIMGYSQLLMAHNLPRDVKTRLETMHAEAERMGKVVRNLLTFARQHPPEKKYLGLNGIIEKTLELRAYQLKLNQVQLEKNLAPDLPRTMLDFHQLQQALLNLLANAEQALVESGRRGRIVVSTRSLGDRIEMRVEDDGPGIAPEIQARVFEPFFTTKKEGKGTGLGLSQCYGIVREHGGSIRVESAPSQGTAVIVELPIVQESDAAARPPADLPSTRLPALRILVIDEETGVQDLLVDLLTSQGHRVDTAADLPEAVRKIGGLSHDLIIAEMKLRHGSGRDIYQAVVERAPTLAGRIVFMAGDGAGPDVLEFARDTGNEVVLKPYRLEELERAIARAMRL